MSEGSGPSGCPCGRSHPPVRSIRRKLDHLDFRPDGECEDRELEAQARAERQVRRIYDAAIAGKATKSGPADWTTNYAGKCHNPVTMAHAPKGGALEHIQVRCRKCGPCLRARTNYWGFAAMEQTLRSQESGHRTWFGTLTLSPDAQEMFVNLAYEEWAMTSGRTTQPAWWWDELCDERFRLVCDQIYLSVQKYWKRLRKKKLAFKYFVVFERHQSGLPHLHFLLHEQAGPIRKRTLEAEWPWGHAKCTLVGGKARSAAAPEEAAWYVVKYLSKSVQARQKASLGYRPRKRLAE